MVKHKIESIIAHNGTEVVLCTNTAYTFTPLDAIMHEYWKQEHVARRQKTENNKRNIIKRLLKRR